MTPPTERQVLYALVAAGFLVVVAVLIVVAFWSGLSPGWWTAVVGSVWSVAAGYATIRWRSTGRVLMVAIGTFLLWTVGTLLTR
jgi:hypothetical protein